MRFLVFLSVVCACHGNPEGPGLAGTDMEDGNDSNSSTWDASFENLDADRMDLVLRSGLSHCSLLATYAFAYSDMDAAITEATPEACPTTEVEGTLVRFIGGCTASGSFTYEGMLEADNAGGLFANHEEGRNTHMRFEDYSMTDSFDAWWFDGSWALPFDATDAGTLEQVALSCDLGKGSFGTFGEQDCVAGEHGRECTYGAGVEGEVSGVGRFGLSGSFAVTEDGYDGELTMKGRQTLVFLLSDASEGCTPYTVDGQPGMHCPE